MVKTSPPSPKKQMKGERNTMLNIFKEKSKTTYKISK
jgi:hypothetical protein